MRATGQVRLGNLPAEVTSFVGRGSELAQVRRLLAGARLVTLTGVGGTGKTRLALHVAAGLRRAFRDGVWCVDLTQLREFAPAAYHPDALAELVSAVLGVHQRGGAAPTRQLIAHLADRQLLLVLDNCEHLIPACALLADALLRSCPHLRVLATSREPLSVVGEVLCPIPPLPTPAAGVPDPARCDSVHLFVARARAVVPQWTMAGADTDAVAELCRSLDGLPLAIELAAARVRTLAPGQILDRLANRFGVLSQGSRGAPPRQQTLRACVEWSFDLCNKAEQLLWSRLSVFADGFELDGAEAVCADPTLPEEDLLDVVAGLVDKSIVVREGVPDSGGGEVSRFRLLETIREFGQQRLRDSGDDDRLLRRHGDWCRHLADQATAECIGPRQVFWMTRLTREQANLRAAIEHSLTAPGRIDAALGLLVALPSTYWFDRGLFREARRWLDEVLERTAGACEERAWALLRNAQIAITQGDAEVGQRLLDQGEEMARRLELRVQLGYAVFTRGLIPLYRGDPSAAVATMERAAAILSTATDADSGPAVQLRLGTLSAIGVAAGLAGDHARADACFQEVLATTEALGEYRQRSYTLWVRALWAWHHGRVGVAETSLVACLRLVRTSGVVDLYSVARCIEALAWVAAGQQRHRRAATLLGAGDRLRALAGLPVIAFDDFVSHHEECERKSRAGLGDAAFAITFARGQAMTSPQALAYALDDPVAGTTPADADRSTPLTRRERQVAHLIGDGLSNRDIAAALVVSQRTVESHVEHILAKLGFSSRTQVAAWNAAQAGPASDAGGTRT